MAIACFSRSQKTYETDRSGDSPETPFLTKNTMGWFGRALPFRLVYFVDFVACGYICLRACLSEASLRAQSLSALSASRLTKQETGFFSFSFPYFFCSKRNMVGFGLKAH